VNRETAGDSSTTPQGMAGAFWECGLLPIWNMCCFVHFHDMLAYLDEYCVGICAELVQFHGFAATYRVGHERVNPKRVFIRSLAGNDWSSMGDWGLHRAED
jgi:hypothetical protein